MALSFHAAGLAPALFTQAPATPDGERAAIRVDTAQLTADLQAWVATLADRALSWSALWQLAVVLLAILIAYVLSRLPARRLAARAEAGGSTDMIGRLARAGAEVVWPVLTVIALWIATAAFDAARLPNEGLRIGASLLNAWIVVRFVTATMTPGFWSRLLAVVAWTVAALYILRLLDPVASALDGAAIEVGNFRLSLLRLLTSVAVALVALWIGRVAGDAAQSQLRHTRSLTPSMAGLLGQVAKIGFMALAVVVALYSVGVNLTALTIFSGALGVGIGFGLQAIFSNFISGIIILFEKSVKVGDFIELQSGVTGLVKEINIRSTLVTTNDNVDILVPNEEFIKAQVINWTLREARRRLRVGFGVSYGSDKDTVRQAGLEAAAEVEWTHSGEPGRDPQVWLVNFGDSSLDFELVVWLTEEAVKKPARVQADYYWALHSALERHGLEIPFPQRDLHLKTPGSLSVTMAEARAAATDGADREG